MKTLDAIFGPAHAENLTRVGLTSERATAIFAAQGFGQPLSAHMSSEELSAVRDVWLADDQPGMRSFRTTLWLISKATLD